MPPFLKIIVSLNLFAFFSDIWFAISVNGQISPSYVAAPIPTETAFLSFTLCFVFETIELRKNSLTTVFSYGHKNRNVYDKDKYCWTPFFELKQSGLKYQFLFFDEVINITDVFPTKTYPVPVCISRNTRGQLKLHISNIDVSGVSKLQSYKNVTNNGILTFGTMTEKTSAGTNCNADKPTNRFIGKFYFAFLYNRFLSNQEILNFGQYKWTLDSSLVVSWDYFKNKKFLYGNTAIEMKYPK